MTTFMGQEFLLDTETAKNLYHKFAESAPIIDYHCHINPKDIYEDTRYENIAQLWLGIGGSNFGDHYKWRLMRSCGIEEKYISGTASDEERFFKWAEALEKAIGNPLYHWTHMELRKYFGYYGQLNTRTAKEVWEKCNSRLKDADMSVRGIIRQSKVELICTTDDPADSLEWHQKIATDKSFDFCQVLPAMRPDKAKNILDDEYPQYIKKLARVSGIEISDFGSLKEALSKRMDFFDQLGGRVSDHAFEFVPFRPASDAEIDSIIKDRLSGKLLNQEQSEKYYTAFLMFLASEYKKRGWVMQIHYGCRRNNNRKMFAEMGPDTGFDCVGDQAPTSLLVEMLNAIEENSGLPKTILYSLNTNDNAAIGSVLGCFQDSSVIAKIQQGSAWWFNDHIEGMRSQLISLANLGNLSGFVGMLTDSRSFLSYVRHDYFRRILCALFGEWVEQGLFPDDYEILGKLVKDVSHNNAVRYFGFNVSEI